ncbi:MAG: LuxR C-terminal-related transcriptional regulator [Planctomycetota bacterium]
MAVENTGNLDRVLHGLARGIEAVHRLPAVATLDWCDQAARSAAALIEPAMAVVTVGSLTESGELITHEASGVSVRLTPARAERAKPVNRQSLGVRNEDARAGTLRVRAAAMRSLGLRIAYQQRSSAIAGLLDELPGGEAVGRGDLAKLWDDLDAGRVAVAVGALGPPESGRVLLVQIAPAGESATLTSEDAAMLAAFMPVLIRRATLALGTEPAEQTRWLTQREQMVLDHLTLGKSVRQIAEDLGRSPHTVHDHVKGLHRKLGASSRGELIARALGHLTPVPSSVDTSHEVKPLGSGRPDRVADPASGNIEPKPAQDHAREG